MLHAPRPTTRRGTAVVLIGILGGTLVTTDAVAGGAAARPSASVHGKAIVATHLRVTKTWRTDSLQGSYAPGGSFTPNQHRGDVNADFWDIKKCHGGYCIDSEILTNAFPAGFRLKFRNGRWKGNLKGWESCAVGTATGSFIIRPVGRSAHPTKFNGVIVEHYSHRCPANDVAGPGIAKGTQKLKVVLVK